MHRQTSSCESEQSGLNWEKSCKSSMARNLNDKLIDKSVAKPNAGNASWVAIINNR